MRYIKVGINDDIYPNSLREIYNPPKVLYMSGNIELLKKECLASIGSRNNSDYGKDIAMKVGEECAKRDVVLVSGMAKGIDYFSHLGCLKGKGETIAVLGTGLDICYPKENVALYNWIKSDGLLISEYPLGTKPTKYSFPMRNRIIAGLCKSLVVVEAELNSGSLITVDLAMDMNKNIYAVPGSILSTRSLGTNMLIRDGIRIVTKIDDIFSDFNIYHEKDTKSTQETIILNFVKNKGEISLKEIAYELNLQDKYAKEILSKMVIMGYLEFEMGKFFIAK